MHSRGTWTQSNRGLPGPTQQEALAEESLAPSQQQMVHHRVRRDICESEPELERVSCALCSHKKNMSLLPSSSFFLLPSFTLLHPPSPPFVHPPCTTLASPVPTAKATTTALVDRPPLKVVATIT